MFNATVSWHDIVFMLRGAGMTLMLTFWSVLGGTVLGTVFGVLRASAPGWPSAAVGALFDVFRSIPLLIQIILANAFAPMVGLDISAFAVACVVLAIYGAAYCTEIVRAGVLAVPQATRRALARHELVGRSHCDRLSHSPARWAARLDRPGARPYEGQFACLVDRGHRASAVLADRRHAYTRTAARSRHRGSDLLRHQLSDRAGWRMARATMARPVIGAAP